MLYVYQIQAKLETCIQTRRLCRLTLPMGIAERGGNAQSHLCYSTNCNRWKGLITFFRRIEINFWNVAIENVSFRKSAASGS
jgi:hypothetical protein